MTTRISSTTLDHVHNICHSEMRDDNDLDYNHEPVLQQPIIFGTDTTPYLRNILHSAVIGNFCSSFHTPRVSMNLAVTFFF